jgi:hypothetical protein
LTGKRPIRARAAALAAAAALLLPLALSAPASADDQPHKGGSDAIVTKTTEPRKLPADEVEADDAAAQAPGVLAIDCPANTYAFNRTESCSNTKAQIQFLLNGKVRGTAQLDIDTSAELNPRDRRKWNQQVEITLTRPTIPEAYLVDATVSLNCSSCTATTGGSKILFPGQKQTFKMEVSSPGKDLVVDTLRPQAVLTAPRHDTGTLALGPAFRPRCDSTPRITDKRYGGCVYPQFTPTWEISVGDPKVAAVGWHVDWAQRNLKTPWGVRGKGHPLHRTTNQALQNANRRVACRVPRPPNSEGQTCDEYPFAATHEGASKNPDYSCHFLNGDNNSKEGSFRKAYLNSQRVLERDAFWVKVVKPTGVAPPQGLLGPVGCGQD